MSYKPVSSSLLNSSPQKNSPDLAAWRPGIIALLRLTFGGIWTYAAWFWWQPAFVQHFANQSTPPVDTQLSGMAAWLTFWTHITHMYPYFFAYFVAIGGTAIALCLLCGAFINLTCGTGILLSLFLWSTTTSFFGSPLQSSPSPGIVVVYILLFLGLSLGSAGRFFGIDRYLATWLGRWCFIASGPLPISPVMIVRYQSSEYPTAQSKRSRGVYPVKRRQPTAISSQVTTRRPGRDSIKGQRISPR